MSGIIDAVENLTMTEPLVTIIIPTLNQGAFIGQTLESILTQDEANVECLVIDGGSTDGTLDLLRNIRDSRLSWLSEPDRGQSDAINKGLHRAHGDLLSYLNSDDLLRPGAIRASVQYLRDHPDVDLVFGDCDLIDDKGARVGQIQGQSYDLAQAFVGSAWVIQPGAFWRRSMSDQVGDFDRSMHYVMDIDYFLRAGVEGARAAYLPGTRAAFRLHGDSKSISAQPKFLSEWRRMMEQLYEQPDLPAALKALRPESEQFIDWAWAKTLWMQKDYASARPLLKKYLRGSKRGRQLLAATMLIDSRLHTPFTYALAALFRKVSGREILIRGARVF